MKLFGLPECAAGQAHRSECCELQESLVMVGGSLGPWIEIGDSTLVLLDLHYGKHSTTGKYRSDMDYHYREFPIFTQFLDLSP